MIGREALDLCLVSVNRDDFVASAIEVAHGLIAELLGIRRRPDDGYAFHSSKYSAWGPCLLSCTVSHWCGECNRSIHSAGAASRLVALLIARICPIFSLFAPCHPGAAPASVCRSVALTTLETGEDMSSLRATLETRTREGELWEPIGGGRIQCYACGHLCRIPVGAKGVCHVRFNRNGHLQVPWGYVGSVQCDPIEKKPFFHAYPGSLAYSFGMLGCDLHCSYCQNWVTSQTLRDPAAGAVPQQTTPNRMVKDALRSGARTVVSTYNEPLITTEWAVAIFKEARRVGLATGFVSNGNATPRVLEYLRPWTDLYKVDLKSFDDRHYRQLGGRLEPVLDTIRRAYMLGLWVEIVTLLIPGFNDSDDELRLMTSFIASVSPDIPWHVTAFYATYRMTDRHDTTANMLTRAAQIGRAQGLRFVYAGNLPGDVGQLEHTHCPTCEVPVIERRGYDIGAYRLTAAGHCGSCGAKVPGRWDPMDSQQRDASQQPGAATELDGL